MTAKLDIALLRWYRLSAGVVFSLVTIWAERSNVVQSVAVVSFGSDVGHLHLREAVQSL